MKGIVLITALLGLLMGCALGGGEPTPTLGSGGLPAPASKYCVAGGTSWRSGPTKRAINMEFASSPIRASVRSGRSSEGSTPTKSSQGRRNIQFSCSERGSLGGASFLKDEGYLAVRSLLVLLFWVEENLWPCPSFTYILWYDFHRLGHSVFQTEEGWATWQR